MPDGFDDAAEAGEQHTKGKSMDWVYDLLRISGLVLLVLGGWSLTDSLARIAKAMERKAPGT